MSHSTLLLLSITCAYVVAVVSVVMLNTAVISFLFIAIHYYFDDVFNTNANRPNAVEGCRDIALNTEQTGRVSEDAVWRTYGPTH